MDTPGSHHLLCCFRLLRQRGLTYQGSVQSEISLVVKVLLYLWHSSQDLFTAVCARSSVAPLLRDLKGILLHGAVS